LKKFGRRHQPAYRLAVMDSRRPRDGKVLEEVGLYQPDNKDEARRVLLVKERIEYWLGVGAQPSDTVRRLLDKQGITKPAAV
jgi:small subunit ribosomal protein S16